VRNGTGPDDPGPARRRHQGHRLRHLRLRPASDGGFVPEMKSGDVMGHETMGVVVETGGAITNLKVGDRVVVPFTISCGE